MAGTKEPIRIGSLIKTPMGIFGVVANFNKKDMLYTIAWSGGLRKGDTVVYDKKMIEHLLKDDGWKLFPANEAPR